MGWLPVVPNGHSLHRLADPEHDPLDQAVASLEAARLRRRVARLPELEQRVLRWRYGIGGDQLTRRQIAARLRISIETVQMVEERALERLRAAYGLRKAA